MVVIVTGAKGVGKTMVCRRLIEIVRNRGYACGGILTYKALDKGIIIEDIQSGEKETLASINNVYHGPHTAKYSFNPRGIEFGIQAIDKGTSAAILVVDEIGHLEIRGEGFAKVFELVKAGKAEVCVLVIRRKLLPAFLPQMPATPLVFETTINNRDQLPQEIVSIIEKNVKLSELLIKGGEVASSISHRLYRSSKEYILQGVGNSHPKGGFMAEKIVGVLGGMGPEATVDFFTKVIELGKTIGKWIIKGIESVGRHHPPTVGP